MKGEYMEDDTEDKETKDKQLLRDTIKSILRWACDDDKIIVNKAMTDVDYTLEQFYIEKIKDD